MRFGIFFILVVSLSVPSVVRAALSVAMTRNANPAPGLESWTLRAIGTEEEVIVGIGGLTLTNLHQVRPAFGQPSTNKSHWTTTNGASDNAWALYDSYLLFDPASAAEVVALIHGGMTEANDGSNPAGLSLSVSGQTATIGLGTFSFDSPLTQLGVSSTVASSNLPFMQVVLPAGGSKNVTGSVTLFSAGGDQYQIDFIQPLTPPDVPEPAAIVLAGLAALGLVGVARRRRK